MLSEKKLLSIGLVIKNIEMLRISVPALGSLQKKFLLVINNTDTVHPISKRDVRGYGYRGALHIINQKCETGSLAARIEIINYIRSLKKRPEWTTFIDECDMLTGISIPCVPADNFAVMTNGVEIRGGLTNLMRVMNNPGSYKIDDKNVFLRRPGTDTNGILFRTDALTKTAAVLNMMLEIIGGGKSVTAPDAGIIFHAVQETVKKSTPNAAPIYMDCVNIVEINPDFGTKSARSNADITQKRDCLLAFDIALGRIAEKI